MATVAAPTNLAVAWTSTIQTDGTLAVRGTHTWTASSSGDVVNYELQVKKSADSAWATHVLAGNVTTATTSPLIPGASYDARLRAVSSSGAGSAWTATLTDSAPGDSTAPGAPSALAATGDFRNIRLTWTNPADTDYSYTEVWEHTSDVRASATLVAKVRGTAYDRSALPAGANTRYYWVRAVDYSGNIGNYNASAGVSATTVAAGTTDIAVANLAAINADLGTVTAGNFSSSGWVQASGNTATLSGTIFGTNLKASIYGQANVDTASYYDCGIVGYNVNSGTSGAGHVGVAGICADTAHTNVYGVFGYAQKGAGVYGYADGSGGFGLVGKTTHASGIGIAAVNTGGGYALTVDGGSTTYGATKLASTRNYYDSLGDSSHYWYESWVLYMWTFGMLIGASSANQTNTTYSMMSHHATHDLSAGDYYGGAVPTAGTAPYWYLNVGGKMALFVDAHGVPYNSASPW